MLFSLALVPLALAASAIAASHGHKRHHSHGVAKRARGDVSHTLAKRFDNARWSFYDVGLGACGQYNVASDFIVALNTPQYGDGYPGPNCFKTITMTYNGKTTQATIMDQCPGCPYGGLDLSRGLFTFFASEDAGIIYGTWSYNDGSGGGGNAPATSTYVYTPPTSTYVYVPPTSTYVYTPPTTSSTPAWTPSTTKTKTSTSSSWVPSSSESSVWSSSAAPSAEPSSSADDKINYSSDNIAAATATISLNENDPQSIMVVTDALLGMAGLAAQAAHLL
ncbi:RlpA-like double-psi beta-barrel-protein domain-containing protein-containing protein [Mucidula mucida]|nr:RlpA-like double-psi beta-barrel-protein domain-containing protein-containing protein [Mucidula mucida]